jgi:hypothetical protein
MNERIHELLKQAVNAVDNPFPSNPLNDELAKMYIPDCFAEKFAELIIQDAIAAVQSWKGEPFPFSEDLAADLIREHFGVHK